jgi:hypothetical protein
MATISFAPVATPAVTEAEITATEIVVPEPKPLAVQTTPPVSGITGEISASDLRPPRLNLVQKSGKLGDEFTPGTFVYDKSFVLTDGKVPFLGTVLRFKKYYQQKLAFGESQEAPKKFDTAAEVKANGGQVSSYNGDNYYQDTADILFAIEAPEGLDEDNLAFFPYVHDSKNYGLAVYTVTSSGFTSIGKRIITDGTLLLREGLWQGQYKVTSERRTSAQNSWFVPVAGFDKKHTPEAAEFFRNMTGL